MTDGISIRRRAGGVLVLSMWAVVVCLAGCTPPESPTPTPTPRDDTLIRAALTEGVHGDTYDVGTGPNTYCAQCKSPVNYDPQSAIDAPPNCVSCKFPNDTQMRVAIDNPVVPESEWQGIRCANCHSPSEAGPVLEEIAWWDTTSDTYIPQSTSTELCEECHRSTGRGVERQRDMSSTVAHQEATCTTCHDPHSGAASCNECHNDQDTTTAFQEDCWSQYLAPDASMPHPDVMCQTCHDNSGLDVGPVVEESEPHYGEWANWRTTMIAGVIPSTAVWVSHDLAAPVDCTRCHFEDNTWGLEAEVTQP
jgi:hypothetical protein